MYPAGDIISIANQRQHLAILYDISANFFWFGAGEVQRNTAQGERRLLKKRKESSYAHADTRLRSSESADCFRQH